VSLPSSSSQPPVHPSPCQVHWFSIFNSLIISVFLTGMVAMILVRALRADIARYNRVLTEEEKAEEREESGWK
jgi:transmembrane 9 superfamily member 2/4